VFRDENVTCPQCEAALEPQGKRLVCTQCRCVLITQAELGAMLDGLSEDDARPFERRVFPAGAGKTTCPRCQTVMTVAVILHVSFEQCTQHGVWMPLDRLQELLARHQELYFDRNDDRTAFRLAAPIPFINVAAMGLEALLGPWVKRRRLRKYLEATTPKPPR